MNTGSVSTGKSGKEMHGYIGMKVFLCDNLSGKTEFLTVETYKMSA